MLFVVAVAAVLAANRTQRWASPSAAADSHSWQPLQSLTQLLEGTGPLPLAAPLAELRPSSADLAVTAADRAACAVASTSGRPLFRLHILDPNTLLPKLPGMRNHSCDPDSLEIWPHVKLWHGTEASPSTPHWAYQHAAGWWVRQALAESSAVHLVDNADEADIVLLDMHCLNTWVYAELFPSHPLSKVGRLSAKVPRSCAQ